MMGDHRQSVTVRSVYHKRYLSLKGALLTEYPMEKELTFNEFVNLALFNFSPSVEEVREIRKRHRDMLKEGR